MPHEDGFWEQKQKSKILHGFKSKNPSTQRLNIICIGMLVSTLDQPVLKGFRLKVTEDNPTKQNLQLLDGQ